MTEGEKEDENWVCPSNEEIREASFECLEKRMQELEIDAKEEDLAKLKEFVSSSEIEKPKSKEEYDAIVERQAGLKKDEIEQMFASHTR
jgi:hypothetical protein